ncbi:MAG: hypothetical protein AB8I08_27940 [Sandaracinaceae bacterium]
MRRSTSLLSVLAAVLVAGALPFGAGCGGASNAYREPLTVTPARDDDPGALVEQQVAHAEELARILAQPEVACGTACSLAGRICELETRICALAERNEDDAETASRCDDATVRCAQAGTRVAEHCTCESDSGP